MFCILNIAVFRPACGEVVEWSKAHAWKACVRLRVPRVRITPSPPNRVAFEPAALLFLDQGCCRHHNRHRSLCTAIIRLLLDTEKRCPRQLYKIGGKCRLFFSKFCRFGRLSVAQLSRKSMRKIIAEKSNNS